VSGGHPRTAIVCSQSRGLAKPTIWPRPFRLLRMWLAFPSR
jgi:hypothetical protein